MALQHLFHSLAIQKQIGIDKKKTKKAISSIQNQLKPKTFSSLKTEAINKLPDDLKPYINTTEFETNKPAHVEEKPGRNEPCPCGSGKKYKKCCGI